VAGKIQLEILNVSPALRDKEALQGSLRAVPTESAADGALTIQGWALGRKTKVTDIEVVSEEQVIGRVPVNLARPDLVGKLQGFPDGATPGFKLTMFAEGQGDSELEVRAVLADGTHAELANISVKVSRKGLLRGIRRS
jgi:hypothetical protein